MESVVRAVDLSYRLGHRALWDGLSFEVVSGALTSLTGPSGAGKSTLLNCIGLLDQPSEGALFLSGQPVAGLSNREARSLRRTHIGYLFQDFALIEADSIFDNVALAAPPGIGRKACAERVRNALSVVGLGGREKDKAFILSSGEQQRVALARILVREPPLILADEPTASLDRANAALVLQLLRGLADNGAAIVIVSHDPWVVSHCDRDVSLTAPPVITANT